MGIQSTVKELIQSNSQNEPAYIPLSDTSVWPGNDGLSNAADNDEEDEDTLAVGELEGKNLRRVSDSIPIAAFTIVLVEFCERFAFYGLSGVFQNYLQNPLPPGGNGAGAPASPLILSLLAHLDLARGQQACSIAPLDFLLMLFPSWAQSLQMHTGVDTRPFPCAASSTLSTCHHHIHLVPDLSCWWLRAVGVVFRRNYSRNCNRRNKRYSFSPVR